MTMPARPSAPAELVSDGLEIALGGVSIELLHAFAAVAAEGHVTRAACKLFLSQPGLTRRLQALERCVGTQLLERSAHGVRLTPAGHALLPFAIEVVTAAQELAQQLRRDMSPHLHVVT